MLCVLIDVILYMNCTVVVDFHQFVADRFVGRGSKQYPQSHLNCFVDNESHLPSTMIL